MKRKMFVASGIVLVLLAITAVVVYAFTFGNVDGVWGEIDADTGSPGTRLDVVGVIGGGDPGTAWGSGTKTTTNDTLIRNADICQGDPDGDATLAEWTGIDPAVYTNLGSHTINSCTAPDLFISEYIEGDGSGATDALEIYNGTGASINFAVTPYHIQIFGGGGSTAGTTIALTGTIAAGGKYVIASANIIGVTENLITGSLSYSGDDAVALVKGYSPDDGLTDGADCDRWATGPSDPENPNLSTGLTVMDSWFDQSLSPYLNTDWNQVRYGQNDFGGCLNFANQSGMAFNGDDEVTPAPIPYSMDESFLMGKFCHINNPINASNLLSTVPLYITMSNVSCNEGYSISDPKLNFTFNVTLDETPNGGTCDYPSTTPCADAVSAPQPDDAFFRCTNDEHPDIYADYTIAALGFIPLSSPTASCEGVTYNPSLSTGIFISQEGSTNCGCLFGMITKEVPTAVKLTSFTANANGESVAVAWETATEIDNLGFNLYRAESLDGVRVKLNDTLIRSEVAPGSTFGAQYSFTDTTVKPYRSYFYWLEDVDAYGVSTFHGPVGVSVQ